MSRDRSRSRRSPSTTPRSSTFSSPRLRPTTAISARPRSTRDRTRSSATSSPRWRSGCDDDARPSPDFGALRARAMNFDRTEEQQILAESVRRFAAREYDFAARRTIIASDAGYSADAWMTMASLGLLGLPFPPECGGSGGGALDLMGVMEIFGDALVVEPYLATVGLGAQFVARSGTPEQRNEILPAVCAGTLKLAFAQTERQSRYNPAHVATRASKTARGYRIDGEKRVVLHACCADRIVVSARTSGADSDATGVTIRPYRTLDSMRAADVSLDNVNGPIDALLGSEHEGLPLIEEVIDYATALLCAEAVGAINYANQATLDYLKTRKQFGVPIGSFQALQHRMVDMTISGEQATSMAR